MDKLDVIQSALSKILGSHRREASIFFVGSTIIKKGNLFIPGLSDTDILVVPRCNSLEEYVKWLEITSELYQELNRAESQLYDIFILSSRIADIHFACLTSIASPLPGEEAIVDRNYNAIKVAKFYINPVVRIELYRAMLKHMIDKARYLLPVADTGQARKTVKYLRKLTKVAICSYARPDELDVLEGNLLGITDLSSLDQLMDDRSIPRPSFDNIFQSVLNGEMVRDWPAWMMAQEELVYWLALLEKDPLSQDIKQTRLYSGVIKVTLMLLMSAKAVLEEQGETRQKKIAQFADETASVVVQLALSGVDSLVDFTTLSTPQRVKESYEILVKHLEADNSTIECLAASIILLEYALECSIVERSR